MTARLHRALLDTSIVINYPARRWRSTPKPLRSARSPLQNCPTVCALPIRWSTRHENSGTNGSSTHLIRCRSGRMRRGRTARCAPQYERLVGTQNLADSTCLSPQWPSPPACRYSPEIRPISAGFITPLQWFRLLERDDAQVCRSGAGGGHRRDQRTTLIGSSAEAIQAGLGWRRSFNPVPAPPAVRGQPPASPSC